MLEDDWLTIIKPTNHLITKAKSAGRIVDDMAASILQTANFKNFTAEEWFQRGERFYYGKAISQSYTKAAECYEKAIEKGSICAACNLGFMLALGKGVNSDLQRAEFLFKSAARTGHPAVLHNISSLHESGAFGAQAKRTAYIFRHLAKTTNEPKFEFYSIYKKNLKTPVIEFVLSDGLPRAGEVYRFPPERDARHITFYELGESLLDACYTEDERTWLLLRKVKLEAAPCAVESNYALVIESGDGPLLCGDLLEEKMFLVIANMTEEQGGMPARAVVFTPNIKDLEDHYYDASGHIVGFVSQCDISLIQEATSNTRLNRLISSLYLRGLGVPENASAAAHWASLH